MEVLQAVFSLAAVYLLAGFLFALCFVWKGSQRIDPAAAESSFGFKLIILPAATILWPLLLRRWCTRSGPPEERSPHRRATGGVHAPREKA